VTLQSSWHLVNARAPAERGMSMSADALQLTKIPTVHVGMLVHRPPHEAFQAFVDPAITTKFWFTKSSDKMTAGAELRWDWEMYGVSTKVAVEEVEANRRIRFQWDDKPTTVELRFTPWGDGATYVEVTEAGFNGDGDELLARVADSTGGFTIVLCALKALLEHGLVLTAVQDAHPKGLQP
jgi:uncharacterized protein YndB with AHSA1/START domain